MKFFCKALKGNFSSPFTYAAIVLFCVLCLFGISVSVENESYSFFNIMSDKELYSQVAKIPECSSYALSYSFSYFSWYSVGFAVLTGIPALYTYIRTSERIQTLSLIRTNYKAYTAGIVFSSFISGAVIVIAGVALYLAIVYALFPSIESFDDPMYLQIYGATFLDRLFRLVKIIVNHAFVGGIIPVFAIVLYRYIHSDFLAATIPMMIMYISVKILPNYRDWVSADPSGNAFGRFLVMIFPSNLAELGRSFESSPGVPHWLVYIVLGLPLCGCFVLFYRSIRTVGKKAGGKAVL